MSRGAAGRAELAGAAVAFAGDMTDDGCRRVHLVWAGTAVEAGAAFTFLLTAWLVAAFLPALTGVMAKRLGLFC